MKKLFTTIFLVFFIFSAYSQTDEYKSMKIMLDSIKSMTTMIEKNNLEIVKIEIDLVLKDVEKTSYKILTTPWTYKVILFADWRVKNTKLEVYKMLDDKSYELVSKDNDSVSIVEFTPKENAWYKFVINSDFKDEFDTAHYGLIIVHEGNYPIDCQN